MDTQLDMHNRVTGEQLERILKLQLETLAKRPEMAKMLPPLMVWGAPGLGKSSILQKAARDQGIGFIDVRLAQREPVDIRGLPVPGPDGVKWLVSSDWPRDPKSRGIILFDEITAADRSLQVAAYEFILDRRLGELYKVPDGWYICAAGNRTEDRAVAATMSSALGRMLEVMKGEPEELVRHMVYGLVGNKAGVEFMEFKKLSETFADVLEMMRNPNAELKVPQRADMKYALCSAAAYHVWRGKDEKDAQLRLDGFYRICMALTSDFASMLMMDAMAGTDVISKDEACDRLFMHKDYKAWSDKHGKALRKHISL